MMFALMKSHQHPLRWLFGCVCFLCFLWLWPACAPTPNKEVSQETTQEQNQEATAETNPQESTPESQPDAAPGDLVADAGPAEKAPEGGPDQVLTCDTPFAWPVAKEAVTVTASDTWKPEIQLPGDAFVRNSSGFEPRWVKFTILLKDPTKVYFQDGQKFLYHHDFVTQHLDPHKGISREDFNKIALRKEGQALVIGTVVMAPDTVLFDEYGITFERQEAYHPKMLKVLYDLVKSKIKLSRPLQDFYFPSFHQSASANQLQACLAQEGITVSSAERWADGDQCYSTGWALGRLVQIPGNAIDRAYKDGRLKPTDILLTDAVPSEIPHVAGVIAMSPTTPNSHVVILAQTFQLPFAYPRKQLDAIKAMVDKEILLRVRGANGCQVDVLDMTGRIDEKGRKILEAHKKAPKIQIPGKASNGKLHDSTNGLTPADIKYFGGKAANFGLLRQAIPDDSPVSIAISFDLWDQFMTQKTKSGKTLGDEIRERLKDFVYPPDIAAVKTALEAIRLLIEDESNFTTQQQQDIIAALKPFDPTKKIRFRSSTNVEDSAIFTGAGLYDSNSGCLADDQDKDEAGPSLCDPTQPKERGVFRAIRKVFASFYNDNAYLERLRFGLDEGKVGMALLVHHSFPDADEMANGVATLKKQGSSYNFKLVTQFGAESVTNPDGNSQPEVLTGNKFGSTGANFYVSQRSSLVPFGTYVMTWKDDYLRLADLLVKVAQAFEKANPGVTEYTLDFEYKKMKPGKVIVKQVRQIPEPANTPTITPFFTGTPQTLCVFQGEYNDVFGNYRLKSVWKLTPKSVELDATGRQASLFQDAEVSYVADGTTKSIKGAPGTWPGAKHTLSNDQIGDSWSDGSGKTARTFELLADVPKLVSAYDTRILLFSDLTWYVKGTYATPVAHIDFNQQKATRSEDFVRLTTNCLDSMTGPNDILKERTFKGADGLEIKTSYYWPPGPGGISAGYTAPLHRWVQTEIKGLTTQPIVLKDYYSQSYRPEHHNFGEAFMFTPGLSADLTKAQRDELNAKDIESIYLHTDRATEILIIGLDGTLRGP